MQTCNAYRQYRSNTPRTCWLQWDGLGLLHRAHWRFSWSRMCVARCCASLTCCAEALCGARFCLLQAASLKMPSAGKGRLPRWIPRCYLVLHGVCATTFAPNHDATSGTTTLHALFKQAPSTRGAGKPTGVPPECTGGAARGISRARTLKSSRTRHTACLHAGVQRGSTRTATTRCISTPFSLTQVV